MSFFSADGSQSSHDFFGALVSELTAVCSPRVIGESNFIFDSWLRCFGLRPVVGLVSIVWSPRLVAGLVSLPGGCFLT